jgi:thiol-disulfide isomerase/thioredoxin
MLRIVAIVLTLLAAGPPAVTPAARLASLIGEYDAAQKEYPLKAAERCAVGCVELAENHPDDPAALEALTWVVRHTAIAAPALPENAGRIRLRGRALGSLRRDHMKSEKLGAVLRLPGVCIIQDPESVKFIEEVLVKSPHRAVRADALERLAHYKLSFATAFLGTLRKDPESAKRMERVWGKEILKAALDADPDRMRKEGERLYEQLAKEYADVPDALTGTVGRRAALKLDGLRRPPTGGRAAPEMEGADLGGKKMTLGSHRGKVVLVAFTGDWCAACRVLPPQQRALEKRLAGKPFVLLDVNSDVQLERRKALNAREMITWPAFEEYDANGTLGPIATRWGIEGWPTLFLIDHKGVIRQKYIGSPGEKVLAEEVDKLVREAEAAKRISMAPAREGR